MSVGAAREVLSMPTKHAVPYRPLGMPCLRDRVAQMAAALVLAPLFAADRQLEQYTCRAVRGALARI